MDSIKVLAIAPYHGLYELLTQAAAKREDFRVTVLEGDLNKGVQMAKKALSESEYDFIFSRGGTAEMLRRSVDIPTLDISISMTEILQVIRLAQNYHDKFAIVSFSSITEPARLLCRLLHYKVRIETVTDEVMLPELLSNLRRDGYMLCIGDNITTIIAKQQGLNTILITSGPESIDTVFDQAKRLSQSLLNQRKIRQLMYGVINKAPVEIMLYDEDNTLFYSTVRSKADLVKNILFSELPGLWKAPDSVIEKTVNGEIFHITASLLPANEDTYLCIYIQRRSNIAVIRQNGIIIQNKSDALSDQFNNYYSFSGVMDDVNSTIERFAQQQVPILLLGEQGTGKDSVAQHIYIIGTFSNHPFYTIDCRLLNDKQFLFLLKNHDSPLNELYVTIYFKNLDAFTPVQCEQLMQFLEHSDLTQRCKIICSFQEPTSSETDALILSLGARMSAVSLYLPPLRERRADISCIATLYISQLNNMLGKQIIGFEPEAMSQLINFDWHFNLDQLHRVLRELVGLTDSLYISAENTARILAKECVHHPLEHSMAIDLHQSLDDITCNIVQMILQQEGGNQTKAAARLGIGRSTIWRIMNRYEQKNGKEQR